MTLKFDRWPWKILGQQHFHFVAIGQFKLELQSGNARIGQNRRFLTDDLAKTIRDCFYATSSFVHHFIWICEFKLVLRSENGICNLDLWPLALVGAIHRATWSQIKHTHIYIYICIYIYIYIYNKRKYKWSLWNFLMSTEDVNYCYIPFVMHITFR